MYAFVHIDKTGGTTLTSVLRREFGVRHCDIRLPLKKRRFDGKDHRMCIEATDLIRVSRLYRNLRGISGHNVKAYSDLHMANPGIQYFTILRDPVARFRSHFLNRSKCHSIDGFTRWINEPINQNWQTRLIAGEPNAQKAIELLVARFGFVWFTERFDEGLLMFGQWLREPGFHADYRRQNQLEHKRRPHDVEREKVDVTYLNTDSAIVRIRNANAEDQKVYDFVAAQIYPRQRAAYIGDIQRDVEALQRRNSQGAQFTEPTLSQLMRNYIYKPLLHCHAI